MTPLFHLRYWIAAPLLEKLRSELAQTSVDREREAYSLGRAHGELAGQQALLTEFTRILDERKALSYEVTEADLERARKGILHWRNMSTGGASWMLVSA